MGVCANIGNCTTTTVSADGTVSTAVNLHHLRDYAPPKPTHVHSTRKPPFFQLPTMTTSMPTLLYQLQAADTVNPPPPPPPLQFASSFTSFKNGAALFLLTRQCPCGKHTGIISKTSHPTSFPINALTLATRHYKV